MNMQLLTAAAISLLSIIPIFSGQPEQTINDLNLKATVATASIEKPVTTIVLSANDQMRFDKEVLRAKAGEKVELVLKHTGTMPESAMGHNFVLLTKGTEVPAFAQAAMKARENEYIPEDGVIAHTELIGGGETTSITFTAPEKGIYDFICSFPGHYALMKGKFIVE